MDVGAKLLAFLSPSDRPGSLGRLGHYEVLEVLGRGGFGTVVRAFDEVLQRVVAIKEKNADLLSACAGFRTGSGGRIEKVRGSYQTHPAAPAEAGDVVGAHQAGTGGRPRSIRSPEGSNYRLTKWMRRRQGEMRWPNNSARR